MGLITYSFSWFCWLTASWGGGDKFENDDGDGPLREQHPVSKIRPSVKDDSAISLSKRYMGKWVGILQQCSASYEGCWHVARVIMLCRASSGLLLQ